MRAECRELRYISVFADLQDMDETGLASLLKRVVAARGELEKVVYAHDLGPKRLLKAGLGGLCAVVGVVTLGAVGPLALAGVAIGVALAAEETLDIAETRFRIVQDADLADILTGLQERIEEECARRGL
ncbi:hypothetical protein [Amphiplicatus metriothermophilus]|uniref:Uncharacterized protein n=1 Tax=Amphiplicatus metriothermophilus TaxID=1519374 RepID=A0A239Q019_9PROT|nr:hypothetical protein [Amphiplicatus metriothermophilus]MBB5520070.1 hypothetical protein [Amphiplicatus metriothermophilus]SNT75864.1 hypothetical protein SAMN06297382_2942 [Amphiplicatus metriothermophilus]